MENTGRCVMARKRVVRLKYYQVLPCTTMVRGCQNYPFCGLLASPILLFPDCIVAKAEGDDTKVPLEAVLLQEINESDSTFLISRSRLRQSRVNERWNNKCDTNARFDD